VAPVDCSLAVAAFTGFHRGAGAGAQSAERTQRETNRTRCRPWL